MFSFDDLKKFDAGDRILVKHETKRGTHEYSATVIRRNSTSLTVGWDQAGKGKVLANSPSVTVTLISKRG